MSLQKTQGMAPSSFGFEPPVTNDSGVGSSVPSKRSSKALDSSDTDAVQKTATAVKRSKKSTFDEINDFEDRIEPNLNLEAAAEVGDGLGAAADIPIRESKLVFSGIQPPYLVYPRSQYEGYRHELPKEKERIVVQFFQSNEQKSGDLSDDPDFFHQYRLDDFSIYHPLNDKRLSGELTCVSNICTRGGFDLLFDGVLSDGQQRRYVEKVPFKVLSVGNYTDLTKHDVSQSLWIQSALNSHSHSNIWYALGTPSGAYAHYWTPFVWLANFAKHFVDYLSEHEFVVLLDFKYKFSKWIKTHHAGHETFDRWFDEYGKDDFRQPVAVHRDWLWNQTCCYSQDLTTRHVWNEVLHLRSVQQAPGAWIEKTVVTPYVHECFEHMFGDKMMVVKPPQNIESLQFSGVHIPSPIRAKRDANGNLVKVDVQVKVGDVIAIQKDEGTEWQSTSNTWYAYVQSIQYSKNDDTKPYALDVIWLYAPSDTTLAKERYPFKNELFFSDHCNCSEDKLYVSDVVTTLAVRFFEGPSDGKEFFIRQKYRTGDPAFLTLSKEDLAGCRHRRILKSPYQTVVSQYQIGDTVLVGAVHGKKDILEPVEIFHFDDFTSEVHVRVLGRRITLEDASKARPNELLYTDKTVPINPQFIHRRCHIRFVYEEDVNAGNIPLPYDRNGTGDCFFISSYLYSPDGEQGIQPFELDKFPQTLHQGFDPHDPPNAPILNGLDLFCGGGNFGRGIEEGGVVNMKWGVDIDVPAIHTYGANLRTPDETALYLGSINNYLRDAIRGKTSYIIAGAGEVGFISAGSPCQGFSNANRNKFSEKSLRNCSLVASVATAVDFYRPKYALLENVHGMAATRIMPDKREINVFSQLLCCLVGMGYQCQQFTLDAWSFGSPQSRTRLFLSIAAPGQRLPPRPPRSHEHPSSIRDLSLFKAPNGLKFGGRELVGPCTYPAPTSREGFDDLPFLGNNHVGICIPFPDHRISRIESWRTRTIMANVPKHGLGVHQNSWRAAMKAGRMPKGCGYEMSISEYKVRDGCKTWSRILGDGLCRTVTTTLTPQCSYTGQWVHYDQDRLITILEARRAQSFPDDEVLLGNASQAFKIVGNSVARSVALAWGLAIRYAYLDEVIEDELDADA